MSVQADETMWLPTMEETAAARPRPRRRRVRGLRLSAVPSMPLLAQVAGGVAALAGVCLLWGLAITLITGGVTTVVLGALKEAGKV
jgi:drug/metabolite transporter (DMT)-like permease